MNGLLRAKVQARVWRGDGGEGCVQVSDVWGVIKDLIAEGREMERPREEDGFGLL